VTSVKRGPCSAPACAILSELTLRRVAYAQQEGITAQWGGALTISPTQKELVIDRMSITELRATIRWRDNVGPDL